MCDVLCQIAQLLNRSTGHTSLHYFILTKLSISTTVSDMRIIYTNLSINKKSKNKRLNYVLIRYEMVFFFNMNPEVNRGSRRKLVYSQHPGHEGASHNKGHSSKSRRALCSVGQRRQLLPGLSRQQPGKLYSSGAQVSCKI